MIASILWWKNEDSRRLYNLSKAAQCSSSGLFDSNAKSTFVALWSELNFISFFISRSNSLWAAVTWAGRKQKEEREKAWQSSNRIINLWIIKTLIKCFLVVYFFNPYCIPDTEFTFLILTSTLTDRYYLTLLHRWRDWDSVVLGNMPKVTQLLRCWKEMWTHWDWPWGPCSYMRPPLRVYFQIIFWSYIF